MSEIAIDIKNVYKTYRMFKKPTDRFFQALSFKKLYHDITVLHDINITIKKGEIVGIVGKNGAGKSTLLKLITGITSPTKGEIVANGKISSLLELGTGFNDEFSGVENIYLNASFLQLSKKEIDERLDDIIEFADIGEYIYEPLKTYSSGMRARLAFSVAINVNPDILIIDEALSVGDVFFREKCFRKFNEFKEKGVTILFVTHSMDNIVKHTTRAFMLHKGELICEGTPNEVTVRYMDFQNEVSTKQIEAAKETKRIQKEQSAELPIYSNSLFNKYAIVIESQVCFIQDLVLKNKTQQSINKLFDADDDVEVNFSVIGTHILNRCRIIVSATTLEGYRLYSLIREIGIVTNQNKDFIFCFKNSLNSGDYFLNFSLEYLNDGKWEVGHKLESAFYFKVVKGKNEGPLRQNAYLVEIKGSDGDEAKNSSVKKKQESKWNFLKEEEHPIDDDNEPFTKLSSYNLQRLRYGTEQARIINMRWDHEASDNSLLVCYVDIYSKTDISVAEFGIIIKDIDKKLVFGTNSTWLNENQLKLTKNQKKSIKLSVPMNFKPGKYLVSVILAEPGIKAIDRIDEAFAIDFFSSNGNFIGLINLPMTIDY